MKIRMQMHRKLPLEKVFYFFAMFCVFSFALLENMSIPIPVFSQIKNPLLYFGGICILLYSLPLLKVLKKKKYFYVMLMLLLFCGSLWLTVEFNRTPFMGNSPKRGTVRLLLYLVELFFLMIWAAESGRGQYTLNFLFYYLLIMTVLTDFLMFSRLIVFQTSREEYYLVGTKFTVAYFHINLLTFWFIRNKGRLFSNRKAKRIIILGIPFVVYVSIYVDCLTGVFGCIAMLIMFALMNTSIQKSIIQLNAPAVFVLALTASVLFPFVAEQIVEIPVVVNFLQNVLGRSANLTGRLNIYTIFIRKMQGHWLWGYGYGNANQASTTLFGYANSQNALLQWVLQVGIPATVLLVALMVMVFHRLNKSNAVVRSMPLVILIYLYMFLGMIEITFDMSFILWIALVFMLSAETESAALANDKVGRIEHPNYRWDGINKNAGFTR